MTSAHNETAEATVADPIEVSGSRVARDVLSLVRPRQWVKNVLVVAAPGAAGVLFEGPTLARTIAAFVALSLAASGTYALNDATDAEADARHPVKRYRPIAAGRISVTQGRILGATLIVAGLAVAALTGWLVAAAVGAYVVLTTSYSLYLKHVPVFDITAIAGGFVLRGLAGAAAADVPVSDWFLIVASFGSLLMVIGKRETELRTLGSDGTTRPILAKYPESFLRSARTLAAGSTLMAYVLFAFERAETSAADIPWFEMSFVPFALGILLYLLRIEQGEAEDPTEVVLRDHTIQIVGAAWAIVFAVGVYTA